MQVFSSFDAVSVVSPEVSFWRKNTSKILEFGLEISTSVQHGYFAYDKIPCLLIQHEGKTVRLILPPIQAENDGLVHLIA